MVLLLALAAAAASPQPGTLKTFGDWTVGCDNGRTCKAVALVPEGEDRETYLLLSIDRGPSTAARAQLRWDMPDGPARRTVLTIERQAVAKTSVPAVVLEPTITAALVKGARVEVTTEDGKTIGSASLSGLAAALRYIDDRQKRVGTVTALVAKGAAAQVAPPPPLPVVIVPPPGTRPPRVLSVARVTKLIGPDKAKCTYSTNRIEPEAYRLDARTSLVTVVHPCGNGAYNIFYSALLVDEAGNARAASFDTDLPKPKEGWNDGLANGGYDPKTGRLYKFMKARGLGDCGSFGEYVWDGKRFRLTERSDMGECRGSLDYITTWRAIVR